VGANAHYVVQFHSGDNLQLSRDLVENINLSGGSFLGVSRGGAKTSEIVDSIQVNSVNEIIYCMVLILHCYFS
jgi:6-phosphofructokinase 1